MSVLMVPELDRKPWPSLGPQVVAFIEQNLTFGPGALRGQPAVVDEETQALICRAYEVYPKGHAMEGTRRFNRVAWSQRKGVAKTEKAAWLAIVELHPDGPVRTVGWKGKQPIGGGVTDPYIPVVAFTEEQSEELVFGAMLAILGEDCCAIGQDFDLGYERIMRRSGDGKVQPLAAAPSARDGARTTFQVFDETHHMSSPRLRKAHQTMLANLPKRVDAWAMEVTTAFAPGENSVAESTMEYARAVAEGKLKDAKLFFFHRQASDHHDLTTLKGIRAAVREASGPAVKWSNVDAIVDQWRDPSRDRTYLERVWLNRIVRAADRAFDAAAWKKLAKPGYEIPEGALVTLGFDGARRRDSTAIVATEVLTGHQAVVGLWEKPLGPAGEGWEVPADAVNEAMDAAFSRFDVWQLAADPAYWESTVDEWAGKYGEASDGRRARVVKRWTGGGMELKTAYAVRAYHHAQLAGEVSHDGDPRFAVHIGNAFRKPLSRRDDEGKPLWAIQKERPDSPNKIDVAMAGVLSWEARGNAIAAGVLQDGGPSVYEERGVLVF